MIIKGSVIFLEESFKNVDLQINNGRFVRIEESIDSIDSIDTIDSVCLDGKIIIPGLVDIHTHGAFGFDFGDCSSDQMKIMSEYYIKNGTTSLLPTLVSISESEYEKQIPKIIENINEDSPFVGINLEGPFISKEKKGAHNDENIREIDLDFAKKLYILSKNNLKLMTVAPELDRFNELVNFSKDKFLISMGHTNCNIDEAKNAINLNIKNVTHLFNAMESMHHRMPSLIGAALEYPLYKELICDGIHVNDSILKGLYRGFSNEIIMVSDSISACGLGDGKYVLGGLDVIVNNKKATLSDGTIAGSANTLFYGIKHLVKIGIKLEDAIRSATSIPAKAINMDNELGSIKVGLKADFIVCDKDLNILSVFKNGQKFK